MKNRFAFLLLLFALSFDGLVNKAVAAGLVPARLFDVQSGQGQALPLQNNSSQGFLLAMLNPDGVNRVGQRRKRRRPRKFAQKAKPKVYGIEVSPGEAGGASPSGASPPPPAEAPASPAPQKRSAPRIKPPTVMIKPPTE
jgi:hypothetical protein